MTVLPSGWTSAVATVFPLYFKSGILLVLLTPWRFTLSEILTINLSPLFVVLGTLKLSSDWRTISSLGFFLLSPKGFINDALDLSGMPFSVLPLFAPLISILTSVMAPSSFSSTSFSSTPSGCGVASVYEAAYEAASGFFSPSSDVVSSSSSISGVAAFPEIFSSTNVCASRLESASSLLAISSSIPAISLSVKSASFRACLWASVSAKASFSSTTVSSSKTVSSSEFEASSVFSVSLGASVVSGFSSSTGAEVSSLFSSFSSTKLSSSLVVSGSAESSATAWFSLSSSAASTEDGDTKSA